MKTESKQVARSTPSSSISDALSLSYQKASMQDGIPPAHDMVALTAPEKLKGRVIKNLVSVPQNAVSPIKKRSRLFKNLFNIGVFFATILFLEIADKAFLRFRCANKLKTTIADVITKEEAENLQPIATIYKNTLTDDLEVFVPENVSIKPEICFKPQVILPEPIIKEPAPLETCEITFSYIRANIKGDCTLEEIKNAYEKNDILVAANEAKIKQEAKQAGQAAADKWKAEKAKLDEEIRRISNPTPEEREEDLKEVYEEMDRKYAGRFGYIPRSKAPPTEAAQCPTEASKVGNLDEYRKLTPIQLIHNPEINPACKRHAEVILGLPQNTNQLELRKRYRSLSLEYHPDKNRSQDSSEAFHLINLAYETLTA